jgi:hypothetical protein
MVVRLDTATKTVEKGLIMEETQHYTDLHVARSWSDTLSLALSFPMRNARHIMRFILPRLVPLIAVIIGSAVILVFSFSGIFDVLNDPVALEQLLTQAMRASLTIIALAIMAICTLAAYIEMVASIGAWYRAYVDHRRIPERHEAAVYVADIRKRMFMLMLMYTMVSMAMTAAAISLILVFSSSPGLAILLGCIVVIAGLYVVVPATFTVPSLVWEDSKVFDAVKRSFVITWGYWWWLVGLGLCFLIIIGIVQNIMVYLPIMLGALAGMVLKDTIDVGILTVAVASVTAIVYVMSVLGGHYLTSSATLVVYASVREAKEGREMQLLIDSIGKETQIDQ